MDIQPQSTQTTQPISDDQELAKVLAGISQENNNLKFEETPPPPVNPVDVPAVSNIPQVSSIPELNITPYTQAIEETPVVPEIPETPVMPEITLPGGVSDAELEDIKKQALLELRPLVEKLNLSPEEKFDIYLLLLRSTDDRELIEPAHEAARNIIDESRRAQALLDIIKEIDFLSNSQQAASI
jgi:hypothetical protein